MLWNILCVVLLTAFVQIDAVKVADKLKEWATKLDAHKRQTVALTVNGKSVTAVLGHAAVDNAVNPTKITTSFSVGGEAVPVTFTYGLEHQKPTPSLTETPAKTASIWAKLGVAASVVEAKGFELWVYQVMDPVRETMKTIMLDSV